MRASSGLSTRPGVCILSRALLVWMLTFLCGCGQFKRPPDEPSAQETPEAVDQSPDPSDPKEPLQVTVGAYINQILEINFAEDYFVIDMWLWFRWEPSRKGQFKFQNSKNFPLENFEITNGQILDRSGELTERKTMNGKPFTYQNVRVIAKITQRFNMRPYPAENHALEILVEDNEERVEKVMYVADTEFSSRGWDEESDVKLPGWRVSARTPEVTVKEYKTNFGNSALNNGGRVVSRYSQFRYVIDLEKPIATSILKSLWPTFLATIVAILALFLHPGSGARFDLAIGAIFAIVANKFTITSSIQDAVQFGYSDVVQIVSASVVAIMLAESIWAARKAFDGSLEARKIHRIDFRCAFILLLVYISLVVALLPVYRDFSSEESDSTTVTQAHNAT